MKIRNPASGEWFRRSLLLILFALPLFPARSDATEALIVVPAQRAVILTGYTRGIKTAALSGEVSGKVLKIHYDIGQTIGTAPFLQVDTTFVDLEIEGSVRTLDRFHVSKRRTASRIAFLEKETRRTLALFEKGSTTEQRRDAVLEELNQARLELESLDVEIAAVRIRMKEQEERRSRHALFAPSGWIVTEKWVEEGEILSQGAPVARISDFRTLVVPLSVSDEEISALQDLPTEFDVHLAELSARAAIRWINLRFDEKSRKREIELLIRRFAGKKRGGLVCRIPLKIRTDGVRIPKAAVSNRYDNPRVFPASAGDPISVFILGESAEYFIIAHDPRLRPGTELLRPQDRVPMDGAGGKRPVP